MAITTYAELKTAVANWLSRDDLTTIIPDFITLGEAKLNRALRLRAMENVATGSVAATVALPTGFLQVRALTVTSSGVTWPVAYREPNLIYSKDGIARFYSIVGDNIYFLPDGSGETYSLTYYKKFDAVADSVNWLLTNAPDAYLYASLLEATPYIQNDSRIPVWESRLQQVIDQLKIADKHDRYGSSLEVVVA